MKLIQKQLVIAGRYHFRSVTNVLLPYTDQFYYVKTVILNTFTSKYILILYKDLLFSNIF
jgi:hypothetical protein